MEPGSATIVRAAAQFQPLDGQ